MEGLPENCIAEIISFTTPFDACRLAAVSPLWQSAADSDYVWVRFLPPRFPDIIARADQKAEYSSLKELFFRFCDSILIDDSRKLVSLKRSSGKISINMSPNELCFFSMQAIETLWEIIPDLSPEKWTELHLGGAPPAAFRFNSISLLVQSCVIGIIGVINPMILSAKTYYSARLIFRFSDNANGLEYPLRAAFHEGGNHCRKRVSLSPRNEFSQPPIYEDSYDEIGMADVRDDGWMELEVGRFFRDEIHEPNRRLGFSLVDESYTRRAGLIVESMDVCPLN